jgi:hypothetical protein
MKVRTGIVVPSRVHGAAVAGTPRKPTAKRDPGRAAAASYVRQEADRMRVRYPGLTNSEVALLERLASNLEAA